MGNGPVLSLLLAVANGSGTRESQGDEAGDQIIQYKSRSLVGDIDGHIWSVPDGGNQIVFDGMINRVDRWPMTMKLSMLPVLLAAIMLPVDFQIQVHLRKLD